MKRKAEGSLVHCADNSCVRVGNPPEELSSVREPTEPTGGDRCNEGTDQRVPPRGAHVARDTSSPAEAFRALLERAGYIVW